MSCFGTESTQWPRKAALGRAGGGGEPRAEWKWVGFFPWLPDPLWLGGISCSSQEPPGPALGDVENGFHRGFHGATALKQLQEGTQLVRPPPLPQSAREECRLPRGSERVLLAVVPGAVRWYC